MSLARLVAMLAAASVVTPPFVLLIPHARQSPLFDRLLWVGTWALAFLGAWIAVNMSGPAAPALVPDLDANILISIILGAAAGGLGLNLVLWLLDRFERPVVEEEEEVEDDPGE